MPYPADTGYLPKIKLNAPTDLIFDTLIDPINALRPTPAKGALFNAQLLGEELAEPPGRIAWGAQSVPVPGTAAVIDCGPGAELRDLLASPARAGPGANPACDPKRSAPAATGHGKGRPENILALIAARPS